MRGRQLASLFVLLLSGLSVAAAASDRTFLLEPATSGIAFQLRALGWLPIRGDARAEGTVTLHAESADIDVSVPLDSLRMSRDGYREWALSAEFFSAQRHPLLRFQARAVSLRSLREGGSIEGELSVRGITRPARFLLEAGDCAATSTRCRVRADGELSRRAFGMKSRRYTLGDTIRVRLDLQLVAAP